MMMVRKMSDGDGAKDTDGANVILQCLMDELQALQMAYAAIEKNLRDLQEDNADLVNRWMAQKAEMANRMNAENDSFRVRQHKILQDKIVAAAADTTVIPPDLERYGISQGNFST